MIRFVGVSFCLCLTMPHIRTYSLYTFVRNFISHSLLFSYILSVGCLSHAIPLPTKLSIFGSYGPESRMTQWCTMAQMSASCIRHEKKIMTHGYDYLFLVPGKVPNNVYVFGLFWVFSIFISHLKIYFLVKYIHAFFIIKRMILMSKLRVSFGRSSITKH